MPPPPRIPDDVREEIADYIRAHPSTPAGSVRAIANQWGISRSGVGRIADLHGIADVWAENAAQTAQATETRRVHIARRRALLQEDLLDAADLA